MSTSEEENTLALIRHCVEQSNVDENQFVIDPRKIRHVTIVAKKIDTMSGQVDPYSHLNLDFPEHMITDCVVAKRFGVGEEIIFGNNGLVFAYIPRNSYSHYGRFDYTERLDNMIQAVTQKFEQSNIQKKINNKGCLDSPEQNKNNTKEEF